jgi:hypothetical protein
LAEPRETAFPGTLFIGMANNMLSSIDWNVEFQAKTIANETRSLYVHRFVLSARSDYYKTSSTHVDFTNFSVRIEIQGGRE